MEGEVLDVLQTRAEDAAKENAELRAEVARLKREVDSEAVMFNMKVAELRNQFHRVEEQIRMKNAEIERLRAGDCDRYSDLITLLPTDNPNPQWTSPLHRGSNRKNICCQKIFGNSFSFQATEMVLTSKWGRIQQEIQI